MKLIRLENLLLSIEKMILRIKAKQNQFVIKNQTVILRCMVPDFVHINT